MGFFKNTFECMGRVTQAVNCWFCSPGSVYRLIYRMILYLFINEMLIVQGDLRTWFIMELVFMLVYV